MQVASIDYESAQEPGPIQFTDPRLFRREALIEERRREGEYLDELIRNSSSQTFSPEIVRDLETISSFAANLGINFDPAAGRNYRRAEENAEVQQEINALRLQMQLEQLRRDLEILRTNLPNQTQVSTQNQNPGPATNPTASSTVTPASFDAINTLITNMQSRLAATPTGNATAPRATSGVASPIDAFYDRAAYRDLLASARNAAALDELHDSQGSALVRLSFAATVLPPPRPLMDSLGVLRMQIEAPEWSPAEVEAVYRLWLQHINRNLNVQLRQGGEASFVTNLALEPVVTRDLFDTIYYYYPVRAGSGCDGLSFDPGGPGAHCGRLVLAVARPAYGPGVAVTASRAGTLYTAFVNPNGPISRIQRAREVLADNPAGFRFQCGGQTGNPQFDDPLQVALDARFLFNSLALAEIEARRILADAGIALPARSPRLTGFAAAAGNADLLIRDFLTRARQERCAEPDGIFRHLYVPPDFETALRSRDYRVAIYDVGPREQAQRLSTAARAANAVSLAAAVAAQAPGSGLGGNASVGYSRSAVGRVDAIERAPLVVSFAEAQETPRRGEGEAAPAAQTMPAFGWLLGPRVTADTRRNRLELQQQLRPYDLSVDLAVPGWWPYLYLNAETAWAPNWRTGSGRTVAAGAQPRRIRVPLGTNSADLAGLTDRLAGTSAVRVPSIVSLVPETVSCTSGAELQIMGQNIWRATTVIIGGKRLEGTNVVRLLPDMGGISVSVPAGAFPALEGARAMVTVLTPYGPATYPINIQNQRADGTCPLPQPAPGGGGNGGQ